MLLGILLVAVATGVRRWLLRASDGHRGGFTPLPLVASADRQALDVARHTGASRRSPSRRACRARRQRSNPAAAVDRAAVAGGQTFES